MKTTSIVQDFFKHWRCFGLRDAWNMLWINATVVHPNWTDDNEAVRDWLRWGMCSPEWGRKHMSGPTIGENQFQDFFPAEADFREFQATTIPFELSDNKISWKRSPSVGLWPRVKTIVRLTWKWRQYRHYVFPPAPRCGSIDISDINAELKR